MQFQKSPLNYLHRALREVRNQEQTLEVRLPDAFPDIGRVLCGWGQVILRGKEWRSDAMEANGGVQAWVLYVPEDGSDVRCVECWIPFRFGWDLGENTREGKICIAPLLRFVDPRSVSARKIMVRAGVAMLGEALVEETAEVSQPGELAEDVEVLKTTYPLMLDRSAGEKAFLLDEDLTLPPSAPVMAKLCYYGVQPEVTECRVSGNRLIFRGNANLHLVYRCEEGRLHSWDFPLPFSQLAELDRVYGDTAQGDMTMAVASLELGLEEAGHLRLKCGLLGQYLIRDREMVAVVSDAYSPGRKVEPEFGELEIPALLDMRAEDLSAEATVNQEADIIVDVGFLPDFPRQRRRENGVELEIPGQFQVLYYAADGSLQAASARWEGQTQLEAGEDTKILMEPQAAGLPQGFPGSGNMQLKAEGKLQLRSMAEQEISMVTGLEIEPAGEKDPSRPSLILRRAGGERLWDIAKSTGSTVSAIRAANGIAETQNADQILLIPVP